ncbi:hypothetical protein CSA56_09060 [candidate division KSB3 bacterium]|uniref:Uncharacterized protein n=1 Tax=candidate division KSB3 bacterium TaxID=2044937 RepID=A0A2G6KEI9_9BACT|nr:MAG: hypothetical protein CSA56_09060 [candidate division KSB3 bacterium]
MKDYEMFQNIPLFSCLNTREIEILAEISEERSYPKDTVILHEGEKTTALYIVKKGNARAVSTDQHGSKVVYNDIRQGDYFGEMSFIDQEPRSVTVVTTEATELLIVPREPFKKILSANPETSFTLMNGLSRNLRKATRYIEDLIFVVAHQELHDAHLDTLKRLVFAAEYKDEQTGDHIARVSRYSGFIAEELGLPEQNVQDIAHAAPMHDIGKIGIPEHILLKPGKLTEDEYAVMKTHTIIGAKILSNPQSNLLKCAQQVALSHHERFDGNGYPYGLSGEDIPLGARIVGLADTFDALVSSRPYKYPHSAEIALSLIKQERGKHFDPVIVDAFLANIEKILLLKEELRSYHNASHIDLIWNDR